MGFISMVGSRWSGTVRVPGNIRYLSAHQSVKSQSSVDLIGYVLLLRAHCDWLRFSLQALCLSGAKLILL